VVAVEFTEEERQAVLLALAKLSIQRPGWDFFLNRTALKIDQGVYGPRLEMRAKTYDGFRQIDHDSVLLPPEPEKPDENDELQTTWEAIRPR
jgi:hypothetical protein